MGLRSRISVINSFIKHPDDIVFSISNWEKLKYLIAAIAYDFGIAFLFIIIMNALSPVLEPYENLLNAESYTIWVSIFIICIFTPFLEETIFRLPLKYERNFLFRGISYLLNKDLAIFWKKNLRIIVYIFAATFGFVHLGNYTNTDFIFYVLAPIIVGSQLFAGMIFSFLRLKLGFLWTVLGHFSHNFILIMLAFLFFHNVERDLVDNEKVRIKTTGIAFTVERNPSFSCDTLQNGNLLCLRAENISLQSIIDTLYPNQLLIIRDNDQLDLNLFSKTAEGYSKEEFIEVLKENYTFKKAADTSSSR